MGNRFDESILHFPKCRNFLQVYRNCYKLSEHFGTTCIIHTVVITTVARLAKLLVHVHI